MPLMMRDMYKALRSAHGVPAEQAEKAAEELAGLDVRMASIEARLTLLTWMVGTNITLTLLLLGLCFQILLRLPR